ncbi:MAG: flagellar hook-length control protein FliK [Terriglobales bacterium]
MPATPINLAVSVPAPAHPMAANPATAATSNLAPAAGPAASHAAALATWQSASVGNALSAAAGQQVQLAVRSDALGTVQLHATMHDNLLGATLAVDRPETHALLSATLPGLERTLNARQIQVGALQLQQQGAGNAGGNQARTPPQPKPQAAIPRLAQSSSPAVASVPVPMPLLAGKRLNLRA